MNKILRLLTVWVLVVATAHGIELNGIFSNGMVLQQGMPVPVWGTGKPGENVTVKFAGQEKSGKVDKDGRWMVKLDSLTASAEPQTLTIRGAGGEGAITDVLVGEVWLASGQSNMGYVMSRSPSARKELPQLADPLLRLAGVGGGGSESPVTSRRIKWAACTPAGLWEFSAVAYYFARDLRVAKKVPVGIVVSAVGGTSAEAWTSQGALESNPILKSIVTESNETLKRDTAKAEVDYQAALAKYNEEAAKAKAEGKRLPRAPQKAQPSAVPYRLYNGKIAPLVPFAFRGVIWYQGESNNGQPELYRTLFPALIRDWRQAFGQEFPFLFVQLQPLAPILPETRDAQLFTWRTVPKTGMVVITDQGDTGIHPPNKEPVGARLALAARAIAYGEKIVYSGPLYDTLKIEGSQAILSFQHVGDGLVAKGGKLTGFEISGGGTNFVAATATIKDDTVVVTSDAVKTPVAVRYNWANVPKGNLFNKNGLPATPFRTDRK